MSDLRKELYQKEESFGLIDVGFYDFVVKIEFEDVSVTAWPERYVTPNPLQTGLAPAVRDIFRGAKQIERNLSRRLDIKFSDVYAINIREEGWENWAWGPNETPKLKTKVIKERVFPILRVKNSEWKQETFPVWNYDWMSEVTHWRLLSITNSIDILARSASGRWCKDS